MQQVWRYRCSVRTLEKSSRPCVGEGHSIYLLRLHFDIPGHYIYRNYGEEVHSLGAYIWCGLWLEMLWTRWRACRCIGVKDKDDIGELKVGRASLLFSVERNMNPSVVNVVRLKWAGFYGMPTYFLRVLLTFHL